MSKHLLLFILILAVCTNVLGTLDLVFGEVGAAGDGDVLLPPGAEILGRDLDHSKPRVFRVWYTTVIPERL